MKTLLMPIALTASLVFIPIANFLTDSPLRLGFVSNAEAIIGMPWTPFSFAGMARRSMYREAVWNAAAENAAAANLLPPRTLRRRRLPPQMPPLHRQPRRTLQAARPPPRGQPSALPIGTTVPYLPPNCTSSVINGVNYFNCDGVYYRAGFQGNNIVYIVSVP